MKNLYVEIAVASGMGAVIGLAIALSCGWALLWCPLIGGVCGILVYRPHDLYEHVSQIWQNVWHACTDARSRRIRRIVARRTRKVSVEFTFIFLVVICSMSMIFVPAVPIVLLSNLQFEFGLLAALGMGI